MFSNVSLNDMILPLGALIGCLLMAAFGSPPPQEDLGSPTPQRKLGAWDWTSWSGTLVLLVILSALMYVGLVVWKLAH